MKKEEEEEDIERCIREGWELIDMQPLSDEDIRRILQLYKKGGLSKEEKEQCWQNAATNGLPYGGDPANSDYR
jgi:DNA-binding SARP family transcriptional activator